MKKFAIDTCLFIDLINFNDAYLKGGKKGLETHIKNTQEKVIKLRRKILKMIGEDLSKYDKDVILNQSKGFLKRKQYDGLIDCYKGNLKAYLDKLKKQPIRNHIEEAYINSRILTFQMLKKEYDEIKNLPMCGEFFKDVVDKKVKLYITNTVNDEIPNHIDNAKNRSAGRKNLKPEKSVKNLMKQCSFININSKKATSAVNNLRDQLLASHGIDKSAMDSSNKSINSNRIFGDATIVAEANVAGINLLTLNNKDFVMDKSVTEKGGSQNNNIRRNRIINIFTDTNNKNFCTDAYPYGVKEYNKKDAKTNEYVIKKPTIQSKFKNKKISKSNDYIQEIEM